MKKAKWFVALLTVALVMGLVAVSAVACGGGEEETTTTAVPESTTTTLDPGTTYTGDDALVLSLGMPAAASLYKTYVTPWMEAVETSSNGRVEITDHPGNALVKEEMQLRALDNGTSDILVFQIGWAPEVFPLMELGDMPMLFPSSDVAARTLWTLIEEYQPEELADYHVLGIMMISPAQYGGYKPVHSVADFQGLSLRSGSPVENDTIEALGATAFPAGTDYVGTQVQQKRFDGLFLTWSFHAGNTVQYLTDYTECSIFLRTMLMVMTKERWNSLPAAVQQALTDNSGLENSLNYINDDSDYNYDNTLLPNLPDKEQDFMTVQERARDMGAEIYVLSDAERAEWAAAVEPVILDWVAKYEGRIPAQEILDRARELIEQYSASAAPAAATSTTVAQ